MRTDVSLDMGMGTTATAEALPLALFAWLSPSFPVGGFAFSHGLEWAVEAGDIRDAAELRGWLDGLLRFGSLRADAVLLAAGHRDPDGVGAMNELALALAPSAERRLETAAQGTAFLAAVTAAWPAPHPALAWLAQLDEAAYPVAVGVAAAAHALPLRATLELFALAAVSNLVSAAVRLGPIGQTDAQATIAALIPAIADLAAWAQTATPADLGTCAWRSDIAAMRHETQYSRLFRS